MADDLFAAIDSRGGAAAAVSGRAWVQAMLDVEAALARACARAKIIPGGAGDAIAAACDAERFDFGALVDGTGNDASPVVTLVKQLRNAVGEEYGTYVHAGATSQDIVDTAASLVAKRALAPLLSDAAGVAASLASLADSHRGTPIAGRTLMQQALPTSFGLKAAGWLTGVDEARAELRRVRDERLAVQMGGPVGKRGPTIAAFVAEDLDLAEPTLPWGSVRLRPVALASALGALAGVLGKLAGDVILLGQNEVGEVREGAEGRGASSAMSHKRNPVASIAIVSCTTRVPALVATMFAAMPQEHERAAGHWQAEWSTLRDLLRLTGSATAWAHDLTANLEVDSERMLANLGDAEVDFEGASELIDRALEAHREGGA